MNRFISVVVCVLLLTSCRSGGSKRQSAEKSGDTMENKYSVQFITVDPGHFHAALVQKVMYDKVSPEVHVYAPEGPDYVQHLDRIESYNNRAEDPTSWEEIVYIGQDFFERMLEDSKGNVVVLSGNNKKKAEYIARSVNAGLNVLADKPMIISPDDFPALEEAFRLADEKGILLYDIMTERYEITTILQKLLSQKEEVFGKLLQGSKEDPAVTKISVHHFSKIVSGIPLQRPAWFFDVEQQGEGIVDVTTHLVDLIQWECFPEQILNPTDINISEARRWPTVMTKSEFSAVTGFKEFPDFLQKDVKDGSLEVYSNGEILYQIKGIWARVSVTWNYESPPGGGDTHYSVMRGSRCDLTIKQGAEEKYIPTLYVENIRGENINEFTAKLKDALASMPYEALEIEPVGKNMLRINVPQEYRISHEEHFGQVSSSFLEYLDRGKLPEWEVPGMITKYFTTTTALKKARINK